MILDNFKLDGKTALVTGASSGLGQAIAIALAEAGADAIIAHVGTTVGGSIGVKGAVCTMEDARCCYRHGR